MKTIVFAFLALLASANAWPKVIRNSDSCYARKVVNEAVDYISERLKLNGLDPYVARKEEYTLNGNEFFARGRYDNFVFSGLSNIRVNSVNCLRSAVDVIITLPRIAANFDNFVGDVTIGSENFGSEFSGSVVLIDLQLDIHIPLGNSVNSLEDLSLTFHVGKIESDFNSFIIQGRDVTASVNNFMANILPNLLDQYEERPFH